MLPIALAGCASAPTSSGGGGSAQGQNNGDDGGTAVLSGEGEGNGADNENSSGAGDTSDAFTEFDDGTENATLPDAMLEEDAGPPECLGLAPPTGTVQRDMLEILNAYRDENDLPRFEYSQILEDVAQAYAERMYTEGFFSHTDPEGRDAGDRSFEGGFCHPFVGENIAWGQNSRSTAVEAMDVFKDSDLHNANMLNDDYAYFGVGLFVDEDDEHNLFFYWVQLFGRDRGD